MSTIIPLGVVGADTCPCASADGMVFDIINRMNVTVSQSFVAVERPFAGFAPCSSWDM